MFDLENISKELTVRAYAKLNLYLDITGKRADGYHLLKSVMQSVSLYDLITFSIPEKPQIILSCNDKDFPLDNRNLIWKACEKFYQSAGLPFMGLKACVQKNIPSMAGMAGGSSDCAAALRGLNILLDAGLDDDELSAIAVRLGADVPFTLSGGTVLCEGIGEKLTRLPDIENIVFAVVKPEVGISTLWAYEMYDQGKGIAAADYGKFEKAVREGSASGIAAGMFNALEQAVSLEEIDAAKRAFLQNGALGAMMTGSGSAVFGIFEDVNSARKCLDNMRGYKFSCLCSPVKRGAEIV